ncbi:hypothetical protein ACXHQL_21320 [Vibrio parahaemolyticus]|nr:MULTISPECIES: hypothetical protein [Vibrio harveyi group]
MKMVLFDQFLKEREECLEELIILINSDEPEQEIQKLKQNRKNR